MITKILDPAKLANVLFLLQLSSFISIDTYEKIEEIVSLDFCVGHILPFSITSAYSLSSFIKLYKFTYKNNFLTEVMPQHKYLYFVRYLKNIIVSHALLSIYFKDYMEKTVLYSFSAFIAYGFFVIIYMHVSDLSYSSKMLKTASNLIWLFIPLILIYTGIMAVLGNVIMYRQISQNFEEYELLIFIALSCIFLILSIISIFIPKIINFKLNLYLQSYVFEIIIVASAIYSLQFYSEYTKKLIFFILSTSLTSDKINHIIIDKFILQEKEKSLI